MNKTPELQGEAIEGEALKEAVEADLAALRANCIKAAFQPGITEAIALLDKLIRDLKP